MNGNRTEGPPPQGQQQPGGAVVLVVAIVLSTAVVGFFGIVSGFWVDMFTWGWDVGRSIIH